MPFGRKSRLSDWLLNTHAQPFDIILLCYHRTEECKLPSGKNIAVFEYLSFKWWMIHDFFQDHPEALSRYDSFFFIDDDIEITEPDLRRLFLVFRALPLQMAQPSLTRDSFMSWRALRHKPLSGYRLVTTVELMCPLMKREALQCLLPTFKLTQSGWGIDLLWGKQLRERFGPRQIAVIDRLQVRHGKPVGLGELYEKIQQPAKAEEDKLRDQFGIRHWRIRETERFPLNKIASFIRYFQLRKFFSGADEPR
jgi:hypothetical protein